MYKYLNWPLTLFTPSNVGKWTKHNYWNILINNFYIVLPLSVECYLDCKISDPLWPQQLIVLLVLLIESRVLQCKTGIWGRGRAAGPCKEAIRQRGRPDGAADLHKLHSMLQSQKVLNWNNQSSVWTQAPSTPAKLSLLHEDYRSWLPASVTQDKSLSTTTYAHILTHILPNKQFEWTLNYCWWGHFLQRQLHVLSFIVSLRLQKGVDL